MLRFDVAMIDDVCGDYVLFDDACSDVEWLVNLVRKSKIRGYTEEFSLFDELVTRWDLDPPN